MLLKMDAITNLEIMQIGAQCQEIFGMKKAFKMLDIDYRPFYADYYYEWREPVYNNSYPYPPLGEVVKVAAYKCKMTAKIYLPSGKDFIQILAGYDPESNTLVLMRVL